MGEKHLGRHLVLDLFTILEFMASGKDNFKRETWFFLALLNVVFQVHATDGDLDRNSDILYFLTGQGIEDRPENSKFAINDTSGEIYVLKPLDRDLPHGRSQWRFTVYATDEGGKGLVGYADVLVNLKDINDNAPFFPQAIYTGNVTENGTAGEDFF
ncbi:hypothetical protein JTE90_020796 [Oedothorax gibbosus]|uniref:Cadherin domain-containing protein n=1 Tax=Oedothorax gibbosus TaxID=931172 RepID=A0AAV6TKF5_9ARAC|nr:hypothetical protein JTE90_020796 [Oedothorax gibbosus]